MAVNISSAGDDYDRWRPSFPEWVFDRLAKIGITGPGLRILDLGTGTGQFARELARHGAAVTGIDPSPQLLLTARRLDAEAHLRLHYITGHAEETGLPGAAFNVVTAAQCWQWFDSAKAMAEAKRLLFAHGRLVICHFDWLPKPGSVVAATEQLILSYIPHWKMAGRDGRYPQWQRDAMAAGFTDFDSFEEEETVQVSHETWRGRVRASEGIRDGLTTDKATAFDRDLTALLMREFPHQPLQIPHRLWCFIARNPQRAI
ncbi:MAG: class I SAM-dependent methyltransferase [Alphaproteobacteria bacterium]